MAALLKTIEWGKLKTTVRKFNTPACLTQNNTKERRNNKHGCFTQNNRMKKVYLTVLLRTIERKEQT